VSVSDAVVVEGNGGATDAVFTVTVHQLAEQAVTVDYATQGFTATSPTDFEPVSGTLTFAPGGPTTQTVTVRVVADTNQEPNEAFFLVLNQPTNATVVGERGTANIIDDDEALLTVRSVVVVAEGDLGTTPAVFNVRRDGSTAGTTTVQWATRPFSATAPADFAPASGMLTFLPGETSKDITVQVAGDTLQEAHEAFFVDLTAPVNATLVTPGATARIIDDDASTLTVEGGTAAEGDQGTTDVVFTVARHGSVDGTATVAYQTAESTAKAGTDFLQTAGNLTFLPGEVSKQVRVPVVSDDVQEAAETFFLDLSGADNATVPDTRATGTIVDDDAGTSFLAVGDATVEEGSTGSGPTATFVVRRFGPTTAEARVDYATTNFTAVRNTATEAGDYFSTTGSLVFAPGETTKNVSVPINPDTTVENYESFYLDLKNPTNVTLADARGEGRIVDDDASVVAMTVGPALVEGDAGTQNAVYTLTRYGPSTGTSSVQFRTGNLTAQFPSDYAAVTQVVTFAPGETTKTVPVLVNGDTVQERSETFYANLFSGVNTTPVNQDVITPILDDDESFLFVDTTAMSEGDPASAGNAVFTVRRFGSLDGRTTVNYATANFSATAPSDFTPTTGTLVFEPGETTKTVAVPVVGDFLREPLEEEFFLNLSAVDNGTLVDAQGRAVIIDDDPLPAAAQVYVNGPGWGADFRNYLQARGLGAAPFGFAVGAGSAQLAAIPWVSGVNQVSIKFAAAVTVDQSDLVVRGVTVPTYATTAFAYDPVARTATWTLAQTVFNDKLLLDLDGDAPNGVKDAAGDYLDGEWLQGADSFPSGNGVSGGDFEYRINVLTADSNRDGAVNALDLAYVKLRINRTASSPGEGAGAYSVFADVNTDGRINALDLGIVKGRLNRRLPPGSPEPAAASGSEGLFADTPVDTGKDRRALLA
jgi:hypothetical protein